MKSTESSASTTCSCNISNGLQQIGTNPMYCCPANAKINSSRCSCESTNASNSLKFYRFAASGLWMCVSYSQCENSNNASRPATNGID